MEAPDGAIRSKSKSGSGLQIDPAAGWMGQRDLALAGADFDSNSDLDFE